MFAKLSKFYNKLKYKIRASDIISYIAINFFIVLIYYGWLTECDYNQKQVERPALI